MLLRQQTIGFHQSRHGQVSGKTISDVFQASALPLLGIHDGTSAERAVGFRLLLEPRDETVATQKMAAGEEFGKCEVFVTDSTLQVAGLM